VVVDDDIDIFDDEQLYWAMTWRTQPHQDVVILENMKAIPLDPSLPTSMPPVSTSKLAWDATIPIERDRADFARCYPTPFTPDMPRKRGPMAEAALDEHLLKFIADAGSCRFQDILTEFHGAGNREILESFGRLRERQLIGRDSVGRYVAARSGST